jgi:hypothetical protein
MWWGIAMIVGFFILNVALYLSLGFLDNYIEKHSWPGCGEDEI